MLLGGIVFSLQYVSIPITMIYLFELGRNNELSRAEIEQVFLSQKISYTLLAQEKQNLFLETTKNIDATKIMNILGGTIKISEQVNESATSDTICEYLNTTQNDGKIQFSISGNNAKEIALSAKKLLKAEGRSVRYIEAKNTATILHNNLIEKNGDLTLSRQGLFVTRAIQAIEEWGERDFGRPGRDNRSGMLPPKLARILINLTGTTNDQTILDPFCGSGTVINEAMALGFKNIFGSDLSEKAIDDTKKNIDWMKEQNPETHFSTPKVFVCDATQLQTHIQKNTIHAIATEPYMGKPLHGNEDKHTLTKQADELRALYLAAFKTFQQILAPGGTIVFIIPRFLHKQEWIRIDILAQIQNFGFSLERLSPTGTSLLYHRPEQFVGREIWKFKKI